MADAEPEHKAPPSSVGNQGCPLGTDVGMAQVDVDYVRPYQDTLRSCPHELGRGQGVVAALVGEDRIEPGLLSLARDRLDLVGAPARLGKNTQRQSSAIVGSFLLPARIAVGHKKCCVIFSAACL